MEQLIATSNVIKKADFSRLILEDFELTTTCTVRPYKKAIEFKTIYLTVVYKGVTVQQLADGTLNQGEVVRWQNSAAGRKAYKELSDGQTVKIQYKIPPSRLDAKDQIAAMLAGKTEEEQDAIFAELRMRAAGHGSVKVVAAPQGEVRIRKVEG